jgi:hypothetical protein
LATSKASSKFDTLENATTGPKISSCISLAFGVIDQGSYDKIMSYIEIGKEEGRLVSGGTGDDSKGTVRFSSYF